MEDHGSSLLRRLIASELPDAVLETHARLGDATASWSRRSALSRGAAFLRDDPELEFDMLTDLTAVDYLGSSSRASRWSTTSTPSPSSTTAFGSRRRVAERPPRSTATELYRPRRTGWSARSGTSTGSASRPSRPAASAALRGVRGPPAAQGLPQGAAPASGGAEELAMDPISPRFTDRPASPEDDFERDLHTEHQVLNMGPSHPATHGTVKFLIELDGENIVNLDIQVGYLHRGFEKECESRHLVPGDPVHRSPELQLGDPRQRRASAWRWRSCSGSRRPSAASGCACCRASSRARGDHLTRCGAACLELAAMTPFLYGIEARELTWDLLEMLCGARVTSNYIRIGGVKHDMPPDFPDTARDSIAKIRELLISDFDDVVTSNRIFVDRLKDTGVISKEDCLRYAVTGPDPALGGRAPRRAQGRAVPRLRRDRLRRSDRRGGRQLRPLPRVRRGDAPEPAHRRAVPGEARGARPRPGQRRSTPACAGPPRAGSSTGWRS